MKKKNTCVMALLIIYENSGEKPEQLYIVLSCVVYSLIENYVCIDYISCQSKTLTPIYPNQHLNKQVSICYSVLAFHNCY